MKIWYSAHIVMFVEFSNKTQNHFPVWENIVLVEAESESQAFEKAEHCGRQSEGDDGGSFRWSDQPAKWVFAGVRKLTECALVTDRPGDGTEVSYSELEVDSRATLDRFVAGDPVKVCYNDRYRSERDKQVEAPKRRRRKQASPRAAADPATGRASWVVDAHWSVAGFAELGR